MLFFGIIITLVLLVKNKPATVFYGLIITAVVGVVFGSFFGLKGMPQLPSKLVSVNFDFSLVGAFLRGFNEMFTHPQCIVAIFSLLFVDFFDLTGTLVAVASKADLIDENGELVNVERALLADLCRYCIWFNDWYFYSDIFRRIYFRCWSREDVLA